MEEKLICINCPVGCLLTAQVENGKVTAVSGNTCPRGEEYARQEITDPRRVITSLMRAQGRIKPFSVKTTVAVPKKLFFDCVDVILAARPQAPIKCGDVVIKDILGTGADVVATQDCI